MALWFDSTVGRGAVSVGRGAVSVGNGAISVGRVPVSVGNGAISVGVKGRFGTLLRFAAGCPRPDIVEDWGGRPLEKGCSTIAHETILP